MTLVSALFIVTFTLVEFIDFRKVHVDTAIVVDRSRGEKLQVVFNMTFPRVPCYCELLYNNSNWIQLLNVFNSAQPRRYRH